MATVSFEGPVGINEADLLDAGPVDGSAHNINIVHELQGELDLDALTRAARWVGTRHESFRTAFARTPDGWRRRVYDEHTFALDVIDVRAEPDPEQAAHAAVMRIFRASIDRSAPNLIRATVFRLGDTRHWFVSHCDHVALDGVGFATCLGELLMGYAALTRGEALDAPPPSQPREHVAATEARLAPLRAAPGDWARPTPDDAFSLRADPTRPGTRDPAGARHITMLGDPDALDAVAQAQGVSRSAPIIAAMALGLRAVAARPDVAFSMIRAGRRDAMSRGVVGCLAWGDLWSTRIDDGATLASVLAAADGFLRDGEAWRMLHIPMAAPPAARLVLNVNRYDTSLSLPGLVAFPRVDITTDVVMWNAHDLLLQVFPMPGAMHAAFRYRASMYEPETIARLADAIRDALAAMVADVNALVPALAAVPR